MPMAASLLSLLLRVSGAIDGFAKNFILAFPVDINLIITTGSE
jgi:hypothetical protein